MIYLTSMSTPKVRRKMEAGTLGAMMSPDQGYDKRHFERFTWAADNGCFSDANRDLTEHLFWLASFRPEARARCLFAVALDVVADPVLTTQRFPQCVEPYRCLGYQVAYVAQNGVEHMTAKVPWDDFDVWFIGGTPECRECHWLAPLDYQAKRCAACAHRLIEWKVSPASRRLAEVARERGKWVHMGRVNSRDRFRAASSFCDSADGTYVAFGPDVNAPKAESWVRESEAQGVLL